MKVYVLLKSHISIAVFSNFDKAYDFVASKGGFSDNGYEIETFIVDKPPVL